MQTTNEQIIHGEELFEAGAFQAALDTFEKVLADEPDNSGALNDAALAAAEVDRPHDAKRYFVRALEADAKNELAFFNLLDLLIRLEDMEGLRKTFRRFEAGIADSAEKTRYQEAILAARVGPETPRTLELSEDIERSADGDTATVGMRLAFVCFRNDHFIKDVEQRLAERHQVKVLHFDYGKVDLEAVQRLLDWADVTWFEWCDNLLVESSRRLRKSSHVVCRLHSFEAFSAWPTQVNWDFVDELVLVAPAMLNILESSVPGISERANVSVIRNGVDLERFGFVDREKGYDLAFVAHLKSIKNPPLLLQCVYRLVQEDSRYKLHIAGKFDDRRHEIYFHHMLDRLGLQKSVKLYGWIDDVSEWLSDKHFIVSTSVHEACPCNTLEAAARGLKPVVHNFFGAEELFPREWLFNSTSEFVDLVRDDDFDSRQYRNVIKGHFDLESVVDNIESLLLSLKASRGPVIPMSLPVQPPGGDGHSGRVAPEVVTARPAAQWHSLDEPYEDFLTGRRFHNGLRVSIGAPEREVPSRPDFLANIAAGKRVIDLGCTDHAPLIERKIAQGSWVHKRIAEAADRCLGVDIDSEGIEAARGFGYEVLQLNIVEDDVPAEIERQYWDYLIVGEVLEHVGDPVAFLSAIQAKYCEFVERIVVTVPNAFRLANFQFAKQGMEVVNSDHRFWFTPYTLAKVMNDARLVVEGYRMVQSRSVHDRNSEALLAQTPLFREGVAMVARLKR